MSQPGAIVVGHGNNCRGVCNTRFRGIAPRMRQAVPLALAVPGGQTVRICRTSRG